MNRPGTAPIRHILCGVDGSDAACRAAERAAQLAVTLNADMTYLLAMYLAVAEKGRTDATFEAWMQAEGLQGEPARFLVPEAEVCLATALRRAAEAGHGTTASIIETGEIASALPSAC